MCKKVIYLIVVLMLAGNALAANNLWLGTVSNDWNIDDNWSILWVPNDQDMVTINGSSTCVIYPGTSAIAKDLNVVAGDGTVGDASLTIKSGASLTIPTYNLDLGYTATTAKSILTIESGAVLNVVGAAPYGNFLNAYRPGPQYVNIAGTVYARNLGFNSTSSIVMNFTERTGKLIVDGNLSERWYIDWWCGFWLDRGVARGNPVIPEWEHTYGFTSSYDPGTNKTTFKSVMYVENPLVALDPIPANDADDVPKDQILEWSAPLKSSGGALTYKVYLSTNSGAMGTGTNVGTATSYTPASNLLAATRYYWRVDVTDPNSGNPVVRTGDVWFFDTAAAYAPVLVSPSDGDLPEVLPTISLNWVSDSTPVTHKVYLRYRDAATWDLIATINKPAATTVTPSTLLYGKAYDWKVDEILPNAVTIAGPIWRFHTITPVCNGGVPFAGDEDGDCDVDFSDFSMMAANWLDCAFEPAAACGHF